MQPGSSSSGGSPPASPNGSPAWSEEQLALHERRSQEIAQAMVDGLNRHSREKAGQEAEGARQRGGSQPATEPTK
jgi:hypothetical protein